MRAGLRCEETERRPGVHITLPPDWQALLGSLSSDRRKSILRRRRRFAEAGRMEFDWDVSTANFEERWTTLVDLHQRRWEAVGSAGCFSSERFTRFHRHVAAELLSTGGIKIAVLSLDGRPLAGDYYYVYDGRVYAYQAGLDPVDGLRLSAGTVCISLGIEAAVDAGLREYDFLRNDHTYKAEWSSERREQVTLRMAHPGAREQLRTTLESGIRFVRPLRQRLTAAFARRQPTARKQVARTSA
jgi:CelD/BcsL family acetyltransferase involved in cellulose biosynthesis